MRRDACETAALREIGCVRGGARRQRRRLHGCARGDAWLCAAEVHMAGMPRRAMGGFPKRRHEESKHIGEELKDEAAPRLGLLYSTHI